MPSVTGTSSSAHTTGAAASLTWSHTSNGDALYVAVALSSNTTTVSTVTFGGAALTYIGRSTIGTNTHEWWWKQAPSASTANIVVTPTASVRFGAGARNVLVSDLTTPLNDLSVLATGSSTTPSITVTPVTTGGLVLDLTNSDNNNQVWTAGASQTADFAQNSEANTQHKVAGSREAGGASVTMSWTLASTEAWYISALSITETVASIGRATQVATEIITFNPNPSLVVSQVAVEVLTSTTIIIPPTVSESTQFLIFIM